MRKLLVVLLALGLIVAFSIPAAAVDVKFSGSYRVRGWLESNHALMDQDAGGEVQQDWYDQRFRLTTVFQVAEGLSLTTRADILERVWGTSDTTTTSTTVTGTTGTAVPANHTHSYDYTYSNTTYDKAANIQFGRVYMTFKTAIGKFDVGYMSGGTFGTVFNDDEADGVPRIKYTGVFGPWIILALTEKGAEVDGLIGSTTTDSDYDKYALAAIYKWEGGQAGALWFYLPDKTHKNGVDGYDLVRNYVPVYFKATMGALYLEGEASYFFGTYDYETAGVADTDLKGMTAYLYGKYSFGPAWVGAQFGYVESDPNDSDDFVQGYYDNADWDPCLILFNYWLSIYQGNLGGQATSYAAGWLGLNNGFLYQIFGGYAVTENLSVSASLTYAYADNKPTGYVDDEYGTEFDIQLNWKIFDNLEYMAGFGYLFTGDYYKGTSADTKIADDYLLIHKLQINF